MSKIKEIEYSEKKLIERVPKTVERYLKNEVQDFTTSEWYDLLRLATAILDSFCFNFDQGIQTLHLLLQDEKGEKQ